MRAAGLSVAIAVVIAILRVPFPTSASAQAPADPAGPVLAAAREALGGHERLTAVRSFVATGRTRQVQGNNLVAIEFQMSWEAPDKYARTDEFPAQDRGPVTAGFNGTALIGAPAPARQGAPPPRGNPTPQGPAGAGSGRGGRSGGLSVNPDANPDAQLTTMKADLARLMLGLFAGSVSSVPLTFRYAGLAEAPEGQADVLEATGPDTFVARFFVDRKTHLPIMVTWQSEAGRQGTPGGPRGLGPPAAGPPPPAPPRGPVESRLYFADYRAVDGVKWPFRIRRAVGSEPAEETNFDAFRINVKIDPRRFEARP
jgi:hypothetical protein